MRHKIAILPGDGIGTEVMQEAVAVLELIGNKTGVEFELNWGRTGGNAIDEFGTAMPEATWNMLTACDAILFGAAGGPKWDNPRATVRAEDGILRMRKELDLFANLRPIKIYPQLADASPLKPEFIANVDIMFIRELSSGLYFGQPKRMYEENGIRYGVDTLLYSELEIERTVRVAFELARTRRKRVTQADKANVMQSSRLWREVTDEVAKDYPDVQCEHILADNLTMQLLRRAAYYDVIVSENTFGDILTDEAGMITGSIGMLPSASLAGLPKPGGSQIMGLYEPVHGSAPDIAGKGIANPVAMILSTAMMLEYSFGLVDEARRIERAINQVLDEGHRTSDLADSADRAVSTAEMGKLILERMVF